MTRAIEPEAQPEFPDAEGNLSVRILAPEEFIGAVIGELQAHDAIITEMVGEKTTIVVNAAVPTKEYASFVRAVADVTQGKGRCDTIELRG